MSDRWWRAARVRNGSESDIAERFQECGAEVCLPTITKTVRPARKRRPQKKTKPLVSGYVFVDDGTVPEDETPEEVRRDHRFYDFLRDVTNRIVSIKDSELDALRAIERNGEPVRYRSGPMFCVGEVITVPVNDEPKYKAFGGMVGQVIAVIGDRVILDNYKFTKPVEFPALKLLRRSVYSTV